ncbi:MAG: hypothetical protein AAGA30_21105 [Planctomycetota bacterium]
MGKSKFTRSRLEGVAKLLQKQVSLEEAVESLARIDAAFPDGQPYFQQRVIELVADNPGENCQLWQYDSKDQSWSELRGESGYAIVQNGDVIDFWMMMNN